MQTLTQHRPAARVAQPSSTRPARRALALVPRASASKEAELQKMQQAKAELAARLEAVAQPSARGGRPVMAASVEGETTAAGLREIDQESFYSALEAAGDKLVVVDFYTAWCGPCKMMYPTLCAMAEEYGPAGVEIVKFECNKKNKELGMQLGIRVAPTFHLYRRGQKLAEMTGAKVDQLRELIEKHK